MKNSSVEWLKTQEILKHFSLSAKKVLTRLDIFPVIDSTNTYLLSKHKEAISGWVCLAEEQTSGRGRQGKTWISPKNTNIYASLLWRFKAAGSLSNLSLAVSVMVKRALEEYGITDSIQLKWPNDVWCQRRKLAGILLERVQDVVVIGVGLNVVLPENHELNWIALSETTKNSVERNKLVRSEEHTSELQS